MHRVMFSIGPVTLYTYGLFVALGFLISTILILRDARKAGISQNTIFDCLMTVLISGLIGGRLLYVVINWEYYLQYPARALMFYEGGLAFQGALLAAILSGIIVARIKKISFWKTADLIAPYIALGQAIGRIGCFLNGCCYGKIVSSGWKVQFPGETVTRMPVQIYLSIGLFLLFFVLLKFRQKQFFSGSVFAMYLIAYGMFRFLMDYLRGDELVVISGIRLSQMISMGTFLCGVLIFIVLKNKMKNNSRHAA